MNESFVKREERSAFALGVAGPMVVLSLPLIYSLVTFPGVVVLWTGATAASLVSITMVMRNGIRRWLSLITLIVGFIGLIVELIGSLFIILGIGWIIQHAR